MKKRRFRWIFTGIGALFAVFLLSIAIALLTAPDVSILRKKNPGETAMMRYREAQAKQKGLRLRRFQMWVPLSRISSNLRHAVLISEDDKFYLHGGFDWQGIRDALEKNIRYGHVVGGGSTITQQLAKNLYLKPTRSPIRKIREAVIAFLLDQKLKKNRILELYLNVIEWGRGVYGAEAAARTHFGKPAIELSLAEAVRLASIIPSPIRFRPDGDAGAWMQQIRRSIVERMLKRHLITEEQCREALTDVCPGDGSAVSNGAAVRESLFVKPDTVDANRDLLRSSLMPDGSPDTSRSPIPPPQNDESEFSD